MEKAVVDQLLFELNRDRMKVRIEFSNFWIFFFILKIFQKKRNFRKILFQNYFCRFPKPLNNWYRSRKIIKVRII